MPVVTPAQCMVSAHVARWLGNECEAALQRMIAARDEPKQAERRGYRVVASKKAMHKAIKPGDGGDNTPIGPLSKKAARKRAKRAPVTTGKHVPERAADPPKSSQHLRPRTAEEIASEQTAEQLALRAWAAMVAQKVLSGMSTLMDELIELHLLDDDDEEADEGWLDDHHKREKKILDEAITDGLDKFPDIAAINSLPATPIQTLPETPGN